jgi:predicted pyridoxine 5'-phosphate oxidase superfamily flavin-nucleotide-binding protein
MPRAFADISFTKSVKATQQRYGSREHNKHFEFAEDPRNRLGEKEAQFIQARDSFYQATVGENGWPYVQHRGGPKGFLKIIDDRHFGYADFRGNFQYISVGNINHNDRVSIILMDYVNRRRLKIWGHAQIVHQEENSELLKLLVDAEYKATIERAIVIRVEALEWNCPQHITQRFSDEDIQQVLAPLIEENQSLRARLMAREQ